MVYTDKWPWTRCLQLKRLAHVLLFRSRPVWSARLWNPVARSLTSSSQISLRHFWSWRRFQTSRWEKHHQGQESSSCCWSESLSYFFFYQFFNWNFPKYSNLDNCELGRHFTRKHIFIVERNILSWQLEKNFTKSTQKYHRYSSLIAVHIIRENLVFPSEIVPKRILINWMEPIHHHLHKAQQNTTDHKVKSFYGVCKKLMGKCVNFEFSEVQL